MRLELHKKESNFLSNDTLIKIANFINSIAPYDRAIFEDGDDNRYELITITANPTKGETIFLLDKIENYALEDKNNNDQTSDFDDEEDNIEDEIEENNSNSTEDEESETDDEDYDDEDED